MRTFSGAWTALDKITGHEGRIERDEATAWSTPLDFGTGEYPKDNRPVSRRMIFPAPYVFVPIDQSIRFGAITFQKPAPRIMEMRSPRTRILNPALPSFSPIRVPHA